MENNLYMMGRVLSAFKILFENENMLDWKALHHCSDKKSYTIPSYQMILVNPEQVQAYLVGKETIYPCLRKLCDDIRINSALLRLTFFCIHELTHAKIPATGTGQKIEMCNKCKVKNSYCLDYDHGLSFQIEFLGLWRKYKGMVEEILNSDSVGRSDAT